MSAQNDLDSRTEIEKIAHLIGVPAEEVRFLDKLSVEELTSLDQKIANAIHSDQSPLWERLASISNFVPGFLAAKICEEILGPSVTANITYYTPPNQATSIAGYMSVPFLAAVSEQIIPEKTADLLKAFPLSTMRKLLKHHVENEKHYTIGSFIDHMPTDKLVTLAGEIRSAEVLLRCLVYVRQKERLGGVVESFDDRKIIELLATTHKLGLWREVVAVVGFLSEKERQRFARLLKEIPQEQQNAALDVARKGGASESLLADLS